MKTGANGASQLALVVKSLPVNAEDPRDVGSIPGLGRCPGEGNGNPLQYACLENPMDRGAQQATVHGVTKSPTQLKRFSSCGLGNTLQVFGEGGGRGVNREFMQVFRNLSSFQSDRVRNTVM